MKPQSMVYPANPSKTRQNPPIMVYPSKPAYFRKFSRKKFLKKI